MGEPEKELDKVLDENEKRQETNSGSEEYEEEDDDDEWEYEDEEDEAEAGVEITELEKEEDLGIKQECSDDATSPIVVENHDEIVNAPEELTDKHAMGEDISHTNTSVTTNTESGQDESNDIIKYKTEE